MTYLSGKADKKRKNISYITYGIIFVILVIFWGFFKKNIYTVIEPAVVSSSVVKSSFGFFPEFMRTYMTSHKALVQRGKELEVEIEKLENSLAAKDAVIREYTLALGASSKDGEDTSKSANLPLVMYPLFQDSTHLYSTVLLSRGFKDGIDVGDMVFVRGRQAVCTIKEVYAVTSLCSLLTASSVATEGVTASSSIALSLVGRGGYYLANITRDTPVTVGETVYLTSDPSMSLGTVTFVSNNNQDTSWYVFVKGAYNPVTSAVFYVHK